MQSESVHPDVTVFRNMGVRGLTAFIDRCGSAWDVLTVKPQVYTIFVLYARFRFRELKKYSQGCSYASLGVYEACNPVYV
jgi:hypothetical protein